MYIYIFYIHNFYYIVFIFYLHFFGMGPAQPTWAGLDPASPARLLAQASNPAGQTKKKLKARVNCSRVHEHCVKVIKLPSHSVVVTIKLEMKIQEGMKKRAYLLL